MKTVLVNKGQLLKTLKANKEDHEKDFEETWDAFRTKAIHNFEQRLKQLKNLRRGEHIDLYVNLDVPENHSDDYQRAIEMLDWSVDKEVELTEQEFRQYVQDLWSWGAVFASSKFAYTGEATRNTIRKPKPLPIENELATSPKPLRARADVGRARPADPKKPKK